MTTVATPPTTVDRHVVIVSLEGSFTPAGERLTGPVTSVDKLEKLIDWASGRALLQPIPRVGGSGRGDDATAPARLWVVGAACRQLVAVPGQRDAGVAAVAGS